MTNSPLVVSPLLADDALDQFADRIAVLPIRHPRRVAIMLAHLGLLITVASFSISIAGMNAGLAACLAGCLFAGAPLHRCIGVVPLVAFVGWLGVSMLLSDYPTKWVASASVPIGLLVAQIVGVRHEPRVEVVFQRGRLVQIVRHGGGKRVRVLVRYAREIVVVRNVSMMCQGID